MIGTTRRALAGFALLLAAFASPPSEAASSSQERQVERARLVLDAFLEDPHYQDMRVYVQNAYGVLIIPGMLKGGLFLGGEHGTGVLLIRDLQTGAWGQPGFYDVYGGSFGLQFGGQSMDVVLTLMNQGTVKKLVESDVKMKFGADAGMAVGQIGATVGAATTTHFGEDIYVFAKSQGLFGGVAIDGSVIVPKDDWNEAYYGRPVKPAEILRQNQQVASAGVNALHQSLTRF